MHASALPGFRDFYPENIALRNTIFAAWRTVAARYGFEEYDGPPLEPLELYTQKSGPEIVGQLYNFEDKGGRGVSLRPEMTPTLARMVSARAQGLKKPIRWFSIGQMFRYERQQRGRLREHFQLNMDVIGERGPLADAELIAAAIDIMLDLGLGPADVQVRLSDRRVIASLLQDAGLTVAQLPLAYGAIDKIEREERGRLRGRLIDGGLTEPAVDRVLEIGGIRGADAVGDSLRESANPDVGEPLMACVAALNDLGFAEFVTVDLSIVRGLAYYTGVVFEMFDVQGALRAVCGGGRYDHLLKALGGVDLPAAGFAMGDVVLGELLKYHGWTTGESSRIDGFLVAVTSKDTPVVLRLANDLRRGGLRIEYGLKSQSVVKQLKLAAARPAKTAVIIGPDERERNEAVVRDMTTGEEHRVPFDALLDHLSGTGSPVSDPTRGDNRIQ